MSKSRFIYTLYDKDDIPVLVTNRLIEVSEFSDTISLSWLKGSILVCESNNNSIITVAAGVAIGAPIAIMA